MQESQKSGALFLGALLCAGLIGLGITLGNAALKVKQLDRSVTVKGLAEKEYTADIVIWPIQFTAAGNDLEALYGEMERQADTIREYLVDSGIAADEISASSPAMTDKSAQQWGGSPEAAFRYTAVQTVTVYSEDVANVNNLRGSLSTLGKRGIVFSGNSYESQPEYLFTRLNEVKPEMVEEATRNAREVAEKFAQDSNSRLGKIRRASQGQFSISDRDRNNPHIKRVRVVSTVEYYLSD